MLDSIGFVWSPNELEPTWNDMFGQWLAADRETWVGTELLREFHAKHNHCNVPRRYTVYPRLGTWVQTQRQARRGTGPYKITPSHVQV